MGFFSRREGTDRRTTERTSRFGRDAPRGEESVSGRETLPAKREPKAVGPKGSAEGKPAPAEAGKQKDDRPYFVSPHPDGGWQVKRVRAQRAQRRFRTKAEAEEYAKGMAAKNGVKVVCQKKDGKIQKKRRRRLRSEPESLSRTRSRRCRGPRSTV